LSEAGAVLSPVKSWVLAMLAPSGVARGCGPAVARRIWPGLRATADATAGRDEGTGALVEPRNIHLARITSCRAGHSPNTVVSPSGG